MFYEEITVDLSMSFQNSISARSRVDSEVSALWDTPVRRLTLLEWFLSQRGYEVGTAASADEALKLLGHRTFDIALIDLRLGTSDGLMLLEEMTNRLPRPNVFMAYPTVSSIKQAFGKGASRYLTKPVDLQELAKALGALF